MDSKRESPADPTHPQRVISIADGIDPARRYRRMQQKDGSVWEIDNYFGAMRQIS